MSSGFFRPFEEVAKALAAEVNECDASSGSSGSDSAGVEAAPAEARKGGAEGADPQASYPDPGPQDEGRDFESAMWGVSRLDHGARRVESTGPLRGAPLQGEALAAAHEAHNANSGFELRETAELLTGLARGVDRKLLRKLRKGAYAVQASLDLHGQNREQAQEAVACFIDEARRGGLRCVTIVHGRGKHSKDRVPVLKESVKIWLTHGELGRGILAFCSAAPRDGGAGALWVLLRKMSYDG